MYLTAVFEVFSGKGVRIAGIFKVVTRQVNTG
jgi:hypothetical protein